MWSVNPTRSSMANGQAAYQAPFASCLRDVTFVNFFFHNSLEQPEPTSRVN